MEGYSSDGSTSFFTPKMPYELQFGVATDSWSGNEIDGNLSRLANETDEISSSAIKAEPMISLKDVQSRGADSNTKTGGGNSEPTPAERDRKRKHYDRLYREKIKKTDEKVAYMRGALQEERDGTFIIIEYMEELLQKQRDRTFAMIKCLKEAQQKRDEKIAEAKRLKKELRRLRAVTTRSVEERGLILSVHRQQLKPQSVTLHVATGPHILGTNSESVDKDQRGTNFETVDKFPLMELAASHSISNGCAIGADSGKFLMKLEVDDDSKVKFSDFADLGGDWIPIGKYSFPPSLHQIVENITEVYGDVSAASRMNLSIAEGIYIMFCASIKEMSDLRLEQVTEDLILKWRDTIRDALRINFKVDFAMEHLKKVAFAYIGLMERRKLNNIASRISNLESQLSAGKAEHSKISKMSKVYMDATEEFIGKAVSSGMF